MRLSSSTGNFSFFVNSVSEKVKLFKDTKFKYVNLEQTGDAEQLLAEDDREWRQFAEDCKAAADYAEIK